MGDWESLFSDVFDRSANAMVILDDRRRITRANPAAVDLFGQDPTGGSADELVVPEEREAYLDDWRVLMETGDISTSRTLRVAAGPAPVTYTVRAHITHGRHLAVALPLHEGEENASDDRATLTPRETEVVGRLAMGETGEEVARQLHLSPETVRTHIRNAMAKLGARTRAHLIVRAIEEGLVRV